MDKYVCCFCGNSVDEKVTVLLAVTNWNKGKDSQETRQLFCHLDCLRKAIKNPDNLYIEEE